MSKQGRFLVKRSILMNDLTEVQKSRLVFLGVLMIAFIGILLYSNILYAPFVYDDYGAVVDNETIKNLKTALKDITNNRYLTAISFAINYAVDGLKPFSYHLLNNLIHIINALLIYYLIILTCRTPQMANSKLPEQFIAFSSAFIFVSHPIQTQAVTYIAQRSTSMATMFYLISLVAFIKARLGQTTKAKVEAVKDSLASTLAFYFLSILSAVLAMKTKEIAFTLPIIIVLFEFCFFSGPLSSQLRTPNCKRFFYLLPIILTILIIPLNMLSVEGSLETIVQDIDIRSRETPNISRADYLLTQLRVIMTYFRLLIFPINQSLDYTYPIYHSLFNIQVLLPFLLLLVIFVIAVYLFYASRIKRNRLRLIVFGIFWFFITLSVESSVIPIRDVIVEHRLYLPSIGFFVASASLVGYFFPNQIAKTALVIFIVLLLSIGTYKRNEFWKDPQLLWEDVLAKFPANVTAYNELGLVFKDQGKYNMAIEQFKKALMLRPNFTPPYYNLGYVQYKSGNYENAVAYFKKALTLKSDRQLYLDILNSLAITYSEMGDDDKAIDTFKRAVYLYPTSIFLYNNLGRQYIKMGKFDLAIETLEDGLKIRNESHLRYNLSVAYAKKMEKGRNSDK